MYTVKKMCYKHNTQELIADSITEKLVKSITAVL